MSAVWHTDRSSQVPQCSGGPACACPLRTRVRHAAAVVWDVNAADDEGVARLQAVQVPAVAHAEGQCRRLGRRRRRRCRLQGAAGGAAPGLPRRREAAAAAAGGGPRGLQRGGEQRIGLGRGGAGGRSRGWLGCRGSRSVNKRPANQCRTLAVQGRAVGAAAARAVAVAFIVAAAAGTGTNDKSGTQWVAQWAAAGVSQSLHGRTFCSALVAASKGCRPACGRLVTAHRNYRAPAQRLPWPSHALRKSNGACGYACSLRLTTHSSPPHAAFVQWLPRGGGCRARRRGPAPPVHPPAAAQARCTTRAVGAGEIGVSGTVPGWAPPCAVAVPAALLLAAAAAPHRFPATLPTATGLPGCRTQQPLAAAAGLSAAAGSRTKQRQWQRLSHSSGAGGRCGIAAGAEAGHRVSWPVGSAVPAPTGPAEHGAAACAAGSGDGGTVRTWKGGGFGGVVRVAAHPSSVCLASVCSGACCIHSEPPGQLKHATVPSIMTD